MKTFEEFQKEFEKAHPTARYSDAVETYHSTYFKESAEVGDGATVRLWSDSHAYTIIKRTPCTLTLRRCKTIRDFKPEWIIGGFSAICTNCEDQKWKYEEDEHGEIIVAHWSNKFQRFRYKDMFVSAGRSEYYDYNF